MPHIEPEANLDTLDGKTAFCVNSFLQISIGKFTQIGIFLSNPSTFRESRSPIQEVLRNLVSATLGRRAEPQ